MNFAAETHVDRSIAEPDAFITTHALGTFVLLEAARARGVRYVQVSTDEVYGSIEEGSFTEDSPLQPSSPYSATKAGADLLVASYHHTYGLEALICRGSNNYGPYQYPEKLIPLMVLNALHGDPLPVYGDGSRCATGSTWRTSRAASATCSTHGAPGETYNVGGPDEAVNLDVVARIIALTGASEDLIEYVTDRPGHDRRYSLGSEKVRALGWERAGALRRGARAHRRLVPRQPRLVGADPLGRLPRLLRAPVRPRAGRAAATRPEPRLERATCCPRARTRSRARASLARPRPLTFAVAVSPLIVTSSTVEVEVVGVLDRLVELGLAARAGVADRVAQRLARARRRRSASRRRASPADWIFSTWSATVLLLALEVAGRGRGAAAQPAASAASDEQDGEERAGHAAPRG